jgi:bifunctional pyridoxal-dependent enzyme with beta-cystathionase and maltose regulon repressor activities
MIVDDIARAIFSFKYKAVKADRIPSIVVYIDYETLHKMLYEINGPVSQIAMEYVEKNTIYGFPVYKVSSDKHGWKVYEVV